MFRPRIIPVLLLQNGAAVKSVRFKNHKYLGDIVNTARLFSEMKADELIILDIEATKKNRLFSTELVRDLSSETTMPLAIGGGIKSLNDIEQLLNAGSEKVILGTIAFRNPEFVYEASKTFGSSTISVCMDIQNINAEHKIFYTNASVKSGLTVENAIRLMQENGAGEIILQSVDCDGMRTGYDTELIKLASGISTIPIVALGGANTIHDFKLIREQGNASACAASSMFVLRGQGVLVNYPENQQLKQIFTQE